MNDVDHNRAKILGGLLQEARKRAGRSIEDCAQVLSMSADDYGSIEGADRNISLPELEVLAIYLEVPMAFFWGSKQLEQGPKIDYALYTNLRQKIIGALLLQARIQAGRTQEELAVALDSTPEQVDAYESGLEAIPYFQLEKLASDLALPLHYFANEEHGPLAKYEAELKMEERFRELPAEVQTFVVEPINLSYLETAIRLSKTDVVKLRAIAEGILDITL